MIYGNLLYHRKNDLTDIVGIRTLVMSRLWQPSRSDLSIEQIDAEEPVSPSVPGGLLLIGSQTQPAGGLYHTSWTYEGIRGDGKGATFRTRSNTLDYGFKPGLAQVSLKLWRGLTGKEDKAFQGLLDKYQGYLDSESDQIIWPATMGATTSAAGLTGASKATGDFNPMFGVQDFFRMEGTYTARYCALNIPKSLSDGDGLVVTNLPGKPQPTTQGRNWLKVPAVWRRRGYIFEIVESFWLSGIGGWPVPVYGDGSATGGTPGSPGSPGGTESAGQAPNPGSADWWSNPAIPT